MVNLDMNNHACFCTGPKNGQPYCPCEMKRRGIVQRNGRWVEPEKDLGEVVTKNNKTFLTEYND